MTLPNFLGIGAMRCGTSWLDVQLRAHPQIYLPQRRKEVHFFDEYFDRGIGWYEAFFPPADEAENWPAIGEISPRYLVQENVPERIRQWIPECKMVAILRNPVDRLFSQYGLATKKRGESRSFEQFLEHRPDAVAKSRYGEQFARYFDIFPRDRFCVLLFEESVAGDRESSLRRLADFLGVDPAGFDGHDCHRPVASSHRPRFARLSALATRASKWLRDRDQDWIVNTAKAIGVGRWFGNAGPLPPMQPETRERLLDYFRPDIERLEGLLGRDLSVWTAPQSAADSEARPPAETGQIGPRQPSSPPAEVHALAGESGPPEAQDTDQSATTSDAQQSAAA